MVEAISFLPKLRTLEISGHSERYFDPTLLGRLPALEDLRVMMPDQKFVNALPGIVKSLAETNRGGLKGLGIICRVCLDIHLP